MVNGECVTATHSSFPGGGGLTETLVNRELGRATFMALLVAKLVRLTYFLGGFYDREDIDK